MLTVMCPNCRYRFSAPGCCEPSNPPVKQQQQHQQAMMAQQHSTACYYGGLLVPRGYTSGGGCFINAPTIINGPAIIETGGLQQVGPRIIETHHRRFDPSKGTRVVRVDERQRTSEQLAAKLRRESQVGLTTCLPATCADDANRLEKIGYEVVPSPTERHITTTCDLTGGSVTITTPNIQSGGCLIRSTDTADIIVQAPQIEIRPKLSGGGCLVQKRRSMEEDRETGALLAEDETVDGLEQSRYLDELNLVNSCYEVSTDQQAVHRMVSVLPRGCEDLPGRRSPPRIGETERSMSCEDETSFFPSYDLTGDPDPRSNDEVFATNQDQRVGQQSGGCTRESCCQEQQMFRPQTCASGQPKSTCCCGSNRSQHQHQARTNDRCSSGNGGVDGFGKCRDTRESFLLDPPSGVQIQVNATVQLPASLGQCTVNITATTANNNSTSLGSNGPRVRNNFNGGGIVQAETGSSLSNNADSINASNNVNERRDGAPTTPVSWLMPCPWGFDPCLMDKEVAKLGEVKRLLQTCGWYHEGLSWRQSESLLKEAPVGRWLMRDSSDSRYKFAVSVQTARGPTSVRVHYFLGRFQLDAEPRLIMTMPQFDCPIKMLEYYVEFSKRIDEHRREVWVDYSGQIYSRIYLTKPLVKEVRSLSHLARLAVNRHKLPTDHLPPLIRNYLAEYPYTL